MAIGEILEPKRVAQSPVVAQMSISLGLEFVLSPIGSQFMLSSLLVII